MTETPGTDAGEPIISFRLAVTIALVGILAMALYVVYSGATGTRSFRKICDAGKGKVAATVLNELSAIGGDVGEASETGTVIVRHADGPQCVVRVTGGKVFSSIYEE